MPSSVVIRQAAERSFPWLELLFLPPPTLMRYRYSHILSFSGTRLPPSPSRSLLYLSLHRSLSSWLVFFSIFQMTYVTSFFLSAVSNDGLPVFRAISPFFLTLVPYFVRSVFQKILYVFFSREVLLLPLFPFLQFEMYACQESGLSSLMRDVLNFRPSLQFRSMVLLRHYSFGVFLNSLFLHRLERYGTLPGRPCRAARFISMM